MRGKRAGGRSRKGAATTGRRRLTPGAAILAGAGLAVAKRGYNRYRQFRDEYKASVRKAQRIQFNKAKARFQARLEQSDNVTTMTAFKVGSQRKLSFDERVQRISRPPIVFKRNYTWSAEVESGRKAFFSIPVNIYGSASALYADVITNFNRFTTNTNAVDPSIETTTSFSVATMQDNYVDYYSQLLQMVNSGSNSLYGQVELFVAKRDVDNAITNLNLPCDPVNLMMYGSTANVTKLLGSNEQIVGQGYAFDTTTVHNDWDANYVMPGSTLNASGVCAQVDPALEVFSLHTKKFVGYYISKVGERKFSLKPGQQVNLRTILNELPVIYRPDQEYTYLKGITYHVVVSFRAGIVGDSTLANTLSTGSGQLSCIMEEKRVIGLRTAKKPLVVMATPALAAIAKANQQIINPDTGVVDLGFEEDS